MIRPDSARSGFTLVEMMIAAVLTVLVLGAALALLTSGNQLFMRGLQVASGRQASLLFFDQLEDDIAACIVVPDHKGDPVAISEDGRTLAFYRVDRKVSTLQTTVAKPVDVTLSDKRGVDQHPVRNGIVNRTILIRDLRFALVRPDPEKKQFAYLLSIEATFPEGGLTGRVVKVKRLIELVQPTSVARFGGFFAREVTPLSFVMLEANKPVAKLLASANLRPGVGPAPHSEASAPLTTGTTTTGFEEASE